jgi:hypothetical protein
MTVYAGACHCGAIRFDVEAEIDHVRICDCSVCAMRGGLMFRVREDALRLKTPPAGLSTYRWGSRTATDYFCPTCGVLPFRRPSRPTPEEAASGVEPFDGWSINTRCLEGFSPQRLPVVRVCGSRLRVERDQGRLRASPGRNGPRFVADTSNL